jgi:3-phytase
MIDCMLMVLAGAMGSGASPASYPSVEATVETTPVDSPEDAADDPAIWIDHANPSSSLIIGTDKQRGLALYDLAGQRVQMLDLGRVNNVDLRQGLTLGGRSVDLVVASNRTDQSVVLYRVDPASRRLAPMRPDRFATGLNEVYGVAIGRVEGETYVFVTEKVGPVQQWRLSSNADGVASATLVRTIAFGSQTEGLVVDDHAGLLYVGEEGRGVHVVDVRPGASATPRLIEDVSSGRLTPDVEGLAIFDRGNGAGYLVVSSQGDHSYAIFDRAPPHRFIASFRVGDAAAIDGVQETDGLDVTPVNLGGAFASGMLVVQDGENPGSHQNFKLVPWDGVQKVIDAAAPR